MQPAANKKVSIVPGNCLGCRDCAGLCRALLELAFLPETVLKPHAALH